MTALELAAKQSQNKELQKEYELNKDKLQKMVYNLSMDFELLETELNLRKNDYSNQKENIHKKNELLVKKLANFKNIIANISTKRNDLENDFCNKFEDFMAEVFSIEQFFIG